MVAPLYLVHLDLASTGEMNVGVLDTRVSRSTRFWAPSTAQLWPRGGSTTEASGEDPHEEAPHEENND
jgi:hypothetical protein